MRDEKIEKRKYQPGMVTMIGTELVRYGGSHVHKPVRLDARTAAGVICYKSVTADTLTENVGRWHVSAKNIKRQMGIPQLEENSPE